MGNEPVENPVLVIPCSGIGKVHGLMSREATYLVTDELAPGQTDTLCLALLVKGDSEAVAAVRSHACITIDGCAKACAEKNVAMAGGQVAKAVQVAAGFQKPPWREARQLNRSDRRRLDASPGRSPIWWHAKRCNCACGEEVIR